MSGASFVNGAMKGFNFVDEEIDENRDERQQELAISENNSRYQESIDYRNAQDVQNQENHEQATAISQQRVDNQVQNNEFNQNRLRNKDALDAKKAKRQELRQRNLVAVQRSIELDEYYDPKLRQEMIDEGIGTESFSGGIDFPDIHSATLSLEPAMAAIGQGDFSVIGTPEFLKSYNTIYEDQINQGIGEYNTEHGGTIVKKEIVELALGPQGKKFVAELEVTLDNGEKYIAPRTIGNSASKNDPVQLIDVADAMDDMMGKLTIAKGQELYRDKIHAWANSSQGTGESDLDTYIKQLEAEGMSLDNEKAARQLDETTSSSASMNKDTEKANLKRHNELSEGAAIRQINIEKAQSFLTAFEDKQASSGAGRTLASWIPGVYTDQGQFDEALDAFSEVAARQQLKASGEIRPTDADVKGMKEAMFGIGRDEDTNIRLLTDYIRGMDALETEMNELETARSNGTLSTLIPSQSAGENTTKEFFSTDALKDMSSEDLINSLVGAQ